LGVRSRAQITAWFVEESHKPAVAPMPAKRKVSLRRSWRLAAAACLVVLLLSVAVVAGLRLAGHPPATGPEITTFAGGGTPAGSLVGGYAGDYLRATEAKLSHPLDIAVSGDSVYIADTWNKVVRKVDERGVITTVAGAGFATLTQTGVAGSVLLPGPQGLAVSPDGA